MDGENIKHLYDIITEKIQKQVFLTKKNKHLCKW